MVHIMTTGEVRMTTRAGMTTYQIKEYPNQSRLYGIIVFSTCYISPIDEIDRIQEEIKGYNGIVLFDLLMCNGFSSNRFIEGLYDGERFVRSTFKKVDL